MTRAEKARAALIEAIINWKADVHDAMSARGLDVYMGKLEDAVEAETLAIHTAVSALAKKAEDQNVLCLSFGEADLGVTLCDFDGRHCLLLSALSEPNPNRAQVAEAALAALIFPTLQGARDVREAILSAAVGGRADR